MKKLLFVMAVLWGGGSLGYWYYTESQGQKVAFRTVQVARGDLQATVNATGTLEPEEVVDVGAQIAGEILSFGPDPRDPSKPISFGSPVDQGTVLARLADSLHKARVDQMKANLTHAEAEVQSAQAKIRQAERDLERSKKLQQKNFVAAQEHDAALAAYETSVASLGLAEAAVALGRANLHEAEINLAYTTIKSPVKGVILDRRVNIGQTVVASLNAPSLFLIAKDLSRMEIWASVNETDIGAIHTGQGVRFTVASFPRDTFRGTVSQIRLNASMTQSVVTYTVVVEVDNKAGRLLPYLTARLQFEVEARKGVLLVPNSALRWKPRAALVDPRYRDDYERSQRPRTTGTEHSSPEAPSTQGMLWVRSGEFVRPVPVKAGLSDGVRTEIDAGEELYERSEVIVGIALAGEADEGTSSPFLPKLKRGQKSR